MTQGEREARQTRIRDLYASICNENEKDSEKVKLLLKELQDLLIKERKEEDQGT